MLIPKKVKWLHPYGYRTEEEANVLCIETYTPKGLKPREVFKVQYIDGVIDYIPTSETHNLYMEY